MEPVKYQGQLLRRNGVAGVGDGDIGLAAAFPDLQTQGSALGAEFYGIVQQIVNHLGDVIPVGDGADRMLREVHIHIQALVVDFLLKGNQHLPGTLFQVEVHLLFFGNALFLLELGDVQHTPYQTA